MAVTSIEPRKRRKYERRNPSRLGENAIQAKVDDDLYEMLVTAAAKNERTISQELRYRLRLAFCSVEP